MIAAASLLFRAAISPNILFGSGHDDELLVRLAFNVVNGKWLGSYSDLGHFALAKSAGYPLFLAFSSFLPWPQTVTVHILLLGGFLIIAREMRFFGLSRIAVSVGFAFAAFFPLWFGDQMSRIYRDGFLAAITVISIGLMIVWRRLVIRASSALPSWRHKVLWLLPLVGVAALLGTFVIVKPFWFGLLVFVLITILSTLWEKRATTGSMRVPLLTGLSSLGILLAGFLGPQLAVSTTNHFHYGVFATDNFSEGEFPRALSLMSAVQPSGLRPFVQVTEEQRRQIYEVSPTASRLEPFLELPDGSGWRKVSCEAQDICDESAAWFPWDLRDAIDSAGLGESALGFENSLRQISDDIAMACETGTIECASRGLAPGISSISDIPTKRLVDAFGQVGLKTLELPQPTGGSRQDVTSSSPSFEAWSAIVPGLELRQTTLSYKADDFVLSDFQGFLHSLYSTIFAILILLASWGLVVSGKGNRADNFRAVRMIGVAAAVAYVIGSAALVPLEASSGMYISSGWALYALPLYPFLLVFILFGIARLARLALARFSSMHPSSE